jgi:hypothetical protein
MCTLSFISNSKGLYLAMNRDESLRRPLALPPEGHRIGNHYSVYPSEPNGGTWIGFNDAGISLALINWHAVPARREKQVVSRGVVVKALLAAGNIDQSYSALEALPLPQMPPFRLIAIALRDRSIAEFRWNQERLCTIELPWKSQHWFSSGFDESAVQIVRTEICENEWKKPGAGTLQWLRALHQSHPPEPGAFSICMHGEKAATVSYTEIVLENGAGVMRYQEGPPCRFSGDWMERNQDSCNRSPYRINLES